MELEISAQLEQLAVSLALGFALGAVYDVFRIFRRTVGLNRLLDAAFCLCAALSLFTLSMTAGGGALHVFMLLSAVLGFFAYMKLLSRAVMKALSAAAAVTGIVLAPMKKALEFFSKAVKKYFSKLLACVKISLKKELRRKAAENEKNDCDRRPGIDDAGRICYSEPRKHKK